jgi:murein DD-endopeptidase MepM/ murein hydrolase activator NlpD
MKTWLVYGLICLPLAQLHISSSYGPRVHPVTGRYAFHNGVDLRARSDTVFAAAAGTVGAVAYDPLPGIYIRLDHADFSSAYGHLSRVFVAPGERVSAGEPIGITGSTGRTTGEHLHFSIRFGGRAINPIEFIYQNLINNSNHE